MRLIETTHLKTWAGSKSAENRFPHIIKMLICAVVQPEKLRMPSGDAVWVPGFDGLIENGETSRFVPTGFSGWELGTEADFRGKANRDYEKRSKDKPEDSKDEKAAQKLDRTQVTYVSATPFVWKDKEDWAASRTAERIWKEVRVVDGVDLQDWLEAAPAVNLQFSSELGLVPEKGLQTPDQAWEEWSYRTEPPASEELVAIDRGEQEKELIGRLVGTPSTFTIRGDSPREAWGFALAALRRITSEEERLRLHARTIVADNEEVAGRLRNIKNLIIVLKQAGGQVSGFLSRSCHVIIPEGNDIHSERNVIVLPRPTHRFFVEALKRIDLPEKEAEHAARACGLSITILQRQHAHSNFERPKWADGTSVVSLLPAILAGRWNHRNEADQGILCRLASASEYGQVESQLREFLLVDEPPLQKIGDMWTLTAPVDAFQLTAGRLTSANLERFKVAFREVFGRFDPKVEISPDKWLYQDLKEERGHSAWLRSGMAETLLLLAERGIYARLTCIPSPSAYAEEVVRGLPGLNADWRVLASIRDQYARLMEAAPGPFLDSLDRLIGNKPADVRRLFVEGRDIFSGGNMHTGLLWGLETLAWSPEYLPRVALALARLAALDPGVKIHNRPINSLREIFLWWHPGTNATIERRIETLDLILDREPEIGWELLSNLLPDALPAPSHSTAKPRWRDFGDLPKDASIRERQYTYISAIFDRALDRVGDDPVRWRSILNSLRVLRPAQQKKAADLLHVIALMPTPKEDKTALWEMLRDFTYQHRTYSSAEWSLAGELLDRLETILPLLAPSDLVQRNRWLFDEWFPDLPSEEENLDIRDKHIEELRKQAVKEILESQGPGGLVTLGTVCKFSGFVASAAVPLMSDIGSALRFIELAISAGETGVSFAAQISGQAQLSHGDVWRKLILKEAKIGVWSPGVIASLLIWWPDKRETWDDAKALGDEVAAEYWRRRQIFHIDGSPEDQTFQIDMLINVGRATEAFDRVALRAAGIPTQALVRLFDATLDDLTRVQTDEEIRRIRITSYHMGKFLDELRKRPDMSREELARREYQVLPLLGHLNTKGLTIHDFMLKDPNFFIEVLSSVFLPAHRDKTQDVEPTPEVQAKAKAGYTLLEGLNKIPGQSEGNQINEDILIEWINAVRKKATEVDRVAIADQKLGEILACAPADPDDGGWPHQIVRNVIEKLAEEKIDHGLMAKRVNMRGTYVKALYEGGVQERVLASQYCGWAEISRPKWPRMARVLENIAKGWEEYARHEDVRVQQERMDD